MPKSTYDLIDTAIITGGGGGIGKAFAQSLIRAGKKVIIVGRTESKLKDAASEIGALDYYTLDTGKTADIPSFVKKVTSDHPEVNCLINNAGVQRPFEFPTSNFTNGDYDFDLAKADQEIDINIRGPMHLAVSLLPHFASRKTAVLVNISSVLGYNPSSLINPVYNGTKAWIHFFTLNLRAQLQIGAAKSGGKGGNIKVVEIVPPTVSTELHRERTDPHDNSKEKNSSALSLEDFISEVEGKLKNGDDTISAGPGNKVLDTWTQGMGEMYRGSLPE